MLVMVNLTRLIILIVLSSTHPLMYQNSANDETCFRSFDDFAYRGAESLPREGNISPYPPWQNLTINSVDSQTPELHEVLAVRSTATGTEVWIGLGNGENPANTGFGIYNVETNTFERISNRFENYDQTIFVSKIFVDSQQQVWGQTGWSRNANVENVMLLSRFNESTNQFEFFDNSIEIPFVGTVYNSSSPSNTEIILDNEDNFWIFAGNGSLYHYNTQNNEISYIAETGRVDDTTLSSDGETIYYQRVTGDVTIHIGDMFLYAVNIRTRDIERMDFPESVDNWEAYSGAPFEDSTGRLWLGPVGFRTTDMEWHLINPSLASIRSGQPFNYFYAMPEITIESSDGRIWYTRRMQGAYPEGTAWYDPSTGEGCMFTTSPVNIVEDSSQILWLVSENMLYNYPLNQVDQASLESND